MFTFKYKEFLLVFALSSSALCQNNLWSFSVEEAITAMDVIKDCSDSIIANGGMDVIVGSSYDTVYLLEGKSGSGQNLMGEQLWSFPMLGTVNCIKSLSDLNWDKRPDIAVGDQNGVITCASGGNGHKFWVYIMDSATVLSIASLPDINNDGISEVLVGSDNDTVYCFSGLVANMWEVNSVTKKGISLWKFNTKSLSLNKNSQGPGSGGGGGKTIFQGANAISVLYNGNLVHGVTVATSSNAIVCLSPIGTNGTPSIKWKFSGPGDFWDIKSFPDMNGDGVEEVLCANGTGVGYLLSGNNGTVIWSHDVDTAALKVCTLGDVNQDGFSDALISDATGKVHCISGKSSANSSDLWTFSTKGNRAITCITSLGDITGDNKPECVIGSSDDSIYTISGTGEKLWTAYMNGTVTSVAAIDDIDGDKLTDVVASSDGSFCKAFKSFGSISSKTKKNTNLKSTKLQVNIISQNQGIVKLADNFAGIITINLFTIDGKVLGKTKAFRMINSNHLKFSFMPNKKIAKGLYFAKVSLNNSDFCVSFNY